MAKRIKRETMSADAADMDAEIHLEQGWEWVTPNVVMEGPNGKRRAYCFEHHVGRYDADTYVIIGN